MGELNRYPEHSHPSSSGSGALLSAMAGAVLGAAGLAWWLLSEAEGRRQRQRDQRQQRLSRFQGGGEAAELQTSSPVLEQRDLHDKVHELNQAIDEVRRQLESFTPQG